MTAATFAAAVIGCGLGSLARFWIGTWRRPHHWPWPTLVANCVGSAVLGAAGALLDAGALGEASAWIVGAGVAGGLTTFSTLAVESVLLWRESRAASLAYLTATAAVGTACGWGAWALAAAAV